MMIDVLRADELTTDLVETWSALQRSQACFDSPYFRPEFTQAVARLRPSVYVAVLSEGSQVVGFLPFERTGRIGRPVGGRLSDYQAVIKASDYTIDPCKLVRACGLSALDFDHLLAEQQEFAPFIHLMDESPVLDFSRGFDGYCAARAARGDAELKMVQRKARKLAREVGPLRVEARSTDPNVLKQLCVWKSEQYRRTNITDVFSFPWTVALLEDLLTVRKEAFAGMMSVLYAGDQPVAMHMGMFSYGVLHYWFPTYDVNFSRYSPGYVLLLELGRFCEPLGITKIDMGRGRTPFKTDMMTDVTRVAVGSVDLRPVTRIVRDRWRRAQDWIRTSPLRPAARIPGRVLYRCREWATFR